MDIVSAVVARIASSLLHLALRQLGYLLHYNHNIKTLKRQARLLADKRERVRAKMDDAERNGEIVKDEVQNWVQSAGKIVAEAEKFLDDEVKASKWCFQGWCINVCSVYRFSKGALRKAKVTSQILENGNFGSTVSFCRAPSPENVLEGSVVDAAEKKHSACGDGAENLTH